MPSRGLPVPNSLYLDNRERHDQALTMKLLAQAFALRPDLSRRVGHCKRQHKALLERRFYTQPAG